MAAEKPPAPAASGSPSDKPCQKKVPKKIHKAEREKHKRDQLNDLFLELGSMLEADRQINGKACVLSDTTRILKELIAQVDCLRKENAALLSESHYVTVEKDELEDENNLLRNEISELHEKLRTRVGYDPAWGPDVAGPTLVVPQTGNVILPLLPPQHPMVIEHAHPGPPRELQLFPEAVSAHGSEPPHDKPPHDNEPPRQLEQPSRDLEPPHYVRRPQARHATSTESWPGVLHQCFARADGEQSGSGVTGGSNVDSVDRS